MTPMGVGIRAFTNEHGVFEGVITGQSMSHPGAARWPFSDLDENVP
jgi:hypothetical protein